MAHPSTPSPFLCLPDEIMEEILSILDFQSDLISLALVSHACSDLVIPRHSEYRVIRVRAPLPAMWAHLARRTDLARNIREVRICDRNDYTALDHYPTTLVDRKTDGAPENTEEPKRVQNMYQALRHMTRLRMFTWTSGVDPKARLRPNPAHEDLVLCAVSESLSLKHVALGGTCGAYVWRGKNVDGQSFPVWNISGLKSLSLSGTTWYHESNAAHVYRMLEQSRDLEFLDLPMEFPHLSLCHFPRLKKLRLHLLSGAALSSPVTLLAQTFLENHPTIEELSWFPIGPVELSPNSLPSLKRLKAGRQVIEALENTDIHRSIECFDIWSLDSQSLANLEKVNRPSVQRIKVHTVGALESVYELARVFPAITWLSMPTVYLSPEAIHPTLIPLDGWLDILPRFSNLEVFRGAGLWNAVEHDKQRMHEAILELIQHCPHLRQLDHCDIYKKRRDVNRIKIIREGLEQEIVRYEVHKPPQWNLFDTMEGAFD